MSTVDPAPGPDLDAGGSVRGRRPRRWWPSLGRAVLAVVLGGVVGVLGTVAHRAQWHDLPVGIVLALAFTLSSAVLCRAWAGTGTLLACGGGWLVTVQVLAVEGPGGDVLVPGQPIGFVWTYGGLALFLVAAFLPRGWFAEQRRQPAEVRASSPGDGPATGVDHASV